MPLLGVALKAISPDESVSTSGRLAPVDSTLVGVIGHTRPRGRIVKRTLTAGALVAASLCLPSAAQTPEELARPRSFAIQNANLATVSGPVRDAGTILLQDGLISAVGEEVSIPPEAWVIDGKGLTVYPGFIHSLI